MPSRLAAFFSSHWRKEVGVFRQSRLTLRQEVRGATSYSSHRLQDGTVLVDLRLPLTTPREVLEMAGGQWAFRF
ncbi:hypothetical protein CEXT_532861 [Caerostris extrusa]|uniref:Uncharacterized protein n=1 Tax=Caerostris extrusa TaxID=172846 RepID=A0AAV4XF84_CAEEX|nr:hypothetical protein CEXT_532861 [Caerostris extrusa]